MQNNSIKERQDVAQVRNERSCPPSSGSPNYFHRVDLTLDEVDEKLRIYRECWDNDVPFSGLLEKWSEAGFISFSSPA